MVNQAFSDRLRVIISECKSLSEFAKKSGITESLIRNYLLGKSLPGLDKLVAIAKTANIEINWLATGVGEIKRGGNRAAAVDVDLLEAVIEAVESYLDQVKGVLKPAKKAQLIAALYDLSLGEEKQTVDRAKVIQLFRLAA